MTDRDRYKINNDAYFVIKKFKTSWFVVVHVFGVGSYAAASLYKDGNVKHYSNKTLSRYKSLPKYTSILNDMKSSMVIEYVLSE